MGGAARRGPGGQIGAAGTPRREGAARRGPGGRSVPRSPCGGGGAACGSPGLRDPRAAPTLLFPPHAERRGRVGPGGAARAGGQRPARSHMGEDIVESSGLEQTIRIIESNREWSSFLELRLCLI